MMALILSRHEKGRFPPRNRFRRSNRFDIEISRFLLDGHASDPVQ
jgi:hypothetical protein